MNPNSSIKRAVISYDNMSQELLDAFKEKYPRGYSDYMADIIKVDKPDGTSFYAVSLEVPGAIYLVKIKVKVDDREDLEEGFFKDDNDVDDEGGDSDGSFPVNDDDIPANDPSGDDDMGDE